MPPPGEGRPQLADAPADIPVPPSAFASLKSGNNSARSEADVTPFGSAALPPRDPSSEEPGTESDEQADQQVLSLYELAITCYR